MAGLVGHPVFAADGRQLLGACIVARRAGVSGDARLLCGPAIFLWLLT
jgi:hypothetical protein